MHNTPEQKGGKLQKRNVITSINNNQRRKKIQNSNK
jgi:hypothetical protein